MPKRDEQILVPFPDENTYLFLIPYFPMIIRLSFITVVDYEGQTWGDWATTPHTLPIKPGCGLETSS